MLIARWHPFQPQPAIRRASRRWMCWKLAPVGKAVEKYTVFSTVFSIVLFSTLSMAEHVKRWEGMPDRCPHVEPYVITSTLMCPCIAALEAFLSYLNREGYYDPPLVVVGH